MKARRFLFFIFLISSAEVLVPQYSEATRLSICSRALFGLRNFWAEYFTQDLSHRKDIDLGAIKVSTGKRLGFGLSGSVYELSEISQNDELGSDRIKEDLVIKFPHCLAGINVAVPLCNQMMEEELKAYADVDSWAPSILQAIPEKFKKRWIEERLPIVPDLADFNTKKGRVIVKPAIRSGKSFDELEMSDEVIEQVYGIYLIQQALLELTGKYIDINPNNLIWIDDPALMEKSGLVRPGLALFEPGYVPKATELFIPKPFTFSKYLEVLGLVDLSKNNLLLPKKYSLRFDPIKLVKATWDQMRGLNPFKGYTAPPRIPIWYWRNKLIRTFLKHTEAFQDIEAKFGPNVRLSDNGLSMMLISDPVVTKQIMKSTDDGSQPSFSKAEPVIAPIANFSGRENLLNEAKFEAWASQRQAFTQYFTPKNIQKEEMTQKVKEEIDHHVDALKQAIHRSSRGSIAVNMKDELGKMTLKVFVRSFLNQTPSEEAITKVTQAFDTALEGTPLEIINPFSTPIHELPNVTPLQGRIKKANEEIDQFAQNLLHERIKSNQSHGDLLDAIIEYYKNEPIGKRDSFILNQLKVFLFTGYNTTSAVLGWSVYGLIQDPRKADLVLQDFAHGKGLDWKNVNQCPFLKQFWSKTVDMSPPLYSTARRANKDFLAKDVNGADFFIPEGTVTILDLLGAQKFPTRFPTQAIEEPHLSYGTGPRVCVGMHFANIEGPMILAALIRNFKMEFTDPRFVPTPVSTGIHHVDPKLPVTLSLLPE